MLAEVDTKLVQETSESTDERALVSIGMPVYNGEEYLRQALDSLLAQDYENFELIISDNASTDQTEEICREYSVKDSRIKYIRQPVNQGPSANFNYLLDKACGDYFMWAAADDLWDRGFIRTLLKAMVADPDRASAFCHYGFIDESGKAIESMPIRGIDYSGRTRFSRLVKLSWFYDDGCFYGLYKRQKIKDLKVPTWIWGQTNRRNPLNIAYPVLGYALSVGDFALAGSAPLWLNRIHTNTQTYFRASHETLLSAYLAFLQRKLNVFYECLRSIYLATSSFLPVIAMMPPLFMRLVFDSVSYWRHFRIQRAVRKIVMSTLGRTLVDKP